MRAPDLGWAARFLGMFLALAESRFEGESTPYPKRVTLAVSLLYKMVSSQCKFALWTKEKE
jgi:hypothetical protein